MPTYEYECRSCGYKFEKRQAITAKPAATCPKCKKRARRLISSGAGLLFKGSGFYITDYRSTGYRHQAAAESKSKNKKSESNKSSSPKSSDSK